jgi:hypothetical protein
VRGTASAPTEGGSHDGVASVHDTGAVVVNSKSAAAVFALIVPANACTSKLRGRRRVVTGTGSPVRRVDPAPPEERIPPLSLPARRSRLVRVDLEVPANLVDRERGLRRERTAASADACGVAMLVPDRRR